MSHISYDKNKKMSALRYYELRSATIDIGNDFTNVAPFFPVLSPKKLTGSMRCFLTEINHCENEMTRNMFHKEEALKGLALTDREFHKYRDHEKWTFMLIVLDAEQSFTLKSVQLDQEHWKVRHCDELIIRTFEKSTIFVRLPPGVSNS